MLSKDAEKLLKKCIEVFDRDKTIEDLDKFEPTYLRRGTDDLTDNMQMNSKHTFPELKAKGLIMEQSFCSMDGLAVFLTEEGYYYFQNQKINIPTQPIQMTNCNVQQIVGNHNIVTQNNNSNLNELLETLLKENLNKEFKEVLLEIQNDNNNGQKNKQKWLDKINTCASVVTLAMASPVVWEYLQKLIQFIQNM